MQAGGKNSRGKSVRVGEGTVVVWVTDGGGEEEGEQREEKEWGRRRRRRRERSWRAGGGRASDVINQDGRRIRSETFRR